MSEEQYDEILTELAGRIGSVSGLLETFFSFLHRKTDFYVQFEETDINATMGFSKGVAEAMILKSFRKYKIKSYKAASPTQTAETTTIGATIKNPNNTAANAPSSSKNAAARTATKTSSKSPADAVPSPVSTDVAGTDYSGSTTGGGSTSSTKPQRPSVQLTDKGQQVPVGNGGVGPNYVWTQTLQEVTVYVDAGACSKGKDVKCDIQAKSLRLSIHGEELISGELEDTVKVDESMWTLNVGGGGDDSQVVITLDKTRKTWWKHAIVGHPEIDPNKVDSTQRIDEYDEQTQQAIRKIMFDQKQKRLGLPTSDELKAETIFEKAKDLPGSPFK